MGFFWSLPAILLVVVEGGLGLRSRKGKLRILLKKHCCRPTCFLQQVLLVLSCCQYNILFSH